MVKPRKNIVVLGSTGTIGINTLDVVSRYPCQFKIVGLSAFNNLDLLERQVKAFSPRYVAVGRDKIRYLKSRLPEGKIKVLEAETGLCEISALPEVDLVVIGVTGISALLPFLKAVQAGKTVAPANKEALVIAGDIIRKEAKKHQARIIPVDSEQSAIFQCLQGQKREDISRILLTASGGSLWRVPRSRFSRLSVEAILNHPRWKMGKKITVDSATMLNKGFEVIEAQRLFDVPVDKIQVVIHPEAIIHSMVEFCDGSILGQMGITDMRLPIQYALTYPDRQPAHLPPMDFFKLKQLHFMEPDYQRFPALALAIDVAKKGGTYPSVLNAADEIAVQAFLSGQLSFVRIFFVLEKVVARHRSQPRPSLAKIMQADAWARQEAQRLIQENKKR